MKELGKKIRVRRLRQKMSQRTLAAAVGKSHAWVALLENGGIQAPASEDLTAIADVLGDDPTVYLSLAGRVNLAAAKVVPATETQPAWAVRLEAKLDTVEELLRQVGLTVEGSAEGLASLLAVKTPAPDHQRADKPAGRARPPSVAPRRQKKRPAGGARPSWEVEEEMQSRAM